MASAPGVVAEDCLHAAALRNPGGPGIGGDVASSAALVVLRKKAGTDKRRRRSERRILKKGFSRSEIFFRIWSLGMSVDAVFCAGSTDLLGRKEEGRSRTTLLRV